MTRGRLVVHAHFYQPFRVDPFSGQIPDDPTAAPFRNWNERITAECYRPIAQLGIPEHISWNLGATLTAYLAREAPAVLAAFAAHDRAGRTGMAQTFHHAILPLASVADRRTEVRWGLRDFAYRFGRQPTAMWLPETAVDLATLRVLAEEGVRAVILAPWQADAPHVDTRRPYRVDVGGGRHITAMFYDGELSGAVSFEPAATADADRFARERVAPRLAAPLPADAPATLVIATDGELYGHHQPFRDLFLQRLVDPAAAAGRAFDVVGLDPAVAEDEHHPHLEIRVRERTSWSCHHGVLRWTAECPDVADGRWKGPLRAAFERLAGGIDTVTEAVARGLPGLDDPWAARDRYVDVVIGAQTGDEFAAACLGAGSTADDRRRLLDLMEAQRWRLGMFSSCGWFWEDPARPETHQVLRAAARAVRLVDGAAGTDLEARLVADLATLRSPSTGMDGEAIYRKALSEVGQPPPGVHHLGAR